MGRLEDEVRELILDRFGGVPKFAQAIDKPPQTIYSMLNHSVAGSSASTVIPMAQALGIDPVRLMEGRVEAVVRRTADVPLLGAVSAGRAEGPIAANGTYPIPVELHESYPRAFLLRISGESMNRVLPSGCLALVNPCTEVSVQNDPYVVVVGNTEATVKRVRALAHGLELAPDSTDPTFRPRLFDYGEPGTEEVRIIGRVLWYTLPATWRLARPGS